MGFKRYADGACGFYLHQFAFHTAQMGSIELSIMHRKLRCEKVSG